ncbi:unnamed protein product [Adineta steineri]|uniref:NAD(P)(+)--arginine ADP-ribosyltransferase n=1 Tax=Adineta steineri TaxID=433720 RepID=A0A818XSS8_9BILA|nr:unnamed protein product [Adineta steineri]CAF3743319.1 unnamed protein product [Adineta steineri]
MSWCQSPSSSTGTVQYCEAPKPAQTSETPRVEQHPFVYNPTLEHSARHKQYSDKSVKQLKQLTAPRHYPAATPSVSEPCNDPATRPTFVMNGETTRKESDSTVSASITTGQPPTTTGSDPKLAGSVIVASHDSKLTETFTNINRHTKASQAVACINDDGKEKEAFTPNGQDKRQAYIVVVNTEDLKEKQRFVSVDRDVRKTETDATANNDDGQRSQSCIPSEQDEEQAGVVTETILRAQCNEKEQVETIASLGRLYHITGENLKARQHLESALKTMSSTLPIDQVVIGSYNSLLGLIYESLGDYNNARKHAEYGLQVHLLLLPPNHSFTAISYFNMGCIYRHLRCYELALTCLEQCLKVTMNILPLDHRQLAPIFHNLGLVCHETNDYENALHNYNKELEILNHSHLIDSQRINIVYDLLEELKGQQNASQMFEKDASDMKKPRFEIVATDESDVPVEDETINLLNTYQRKGLSLVERRSVFPRQEPSLFMVKTATQVITESLNIGRSTLWSPVNQRYESRKSTSKSPIVKTATLSLSEIDFMFPGNKKTQRKNNQNLEGSTLAWIDKNLDDPDVDKLLKKFHLPIRMREIINYIRGFPNATEALQYISKADEEDIFVVVTAEEMTDELFMSQLVDVPQVKSVYVFNPDKQPVEFKPHPKLRGVFTELRPLILILKNDVDSYNAQTDILFNVLNSDQIERSLRNLTQESVSFMWYDIMIDILLRLEQKNAKQEMIELCRLHYLGNEKQLEKVTEFEKTYKSEEAALWYSKDSFVYRIVNYALRTQNAATIHSFRYYICDLHKHLVKNHPKFISMLPLKNNILSVYRGQTIKAKEFERCSQDVFISMNTFFSTSTYSPTAVMFAGDSAESTSRSILFEIEVDTKIDTKPYAYLNENVNQDSEREVLFSIGSTFRVDSIEEEALGQTELVKLVLSKSENMQIQKMKLHWENLLNLDKNPLRETAWGTFLFTIGEYNAAEEYFLELLTSQPMDDESLWAIHSDLGRTYYEKEDWEKSLSHYRQALQIIEKYLSRSQINMTRHKLYTSSHLIRGKSVLCNDIAGVLQKMEDYDNAFELYQTALAIDTDIGYGNPDLYEVAKTYNNIGLLYMDKNDNEKAFEYVDKAREICSSPMIDSGSVDMDSNLAAIYNNIGLIHKTKGNFKSATNAFKKSVELAKKTLPENHPSLMQYTRNLTDLENESGNVWV